MAKVLGIDLGTTNSAMAVIQNGTLVVLENAEGSRLTPSVVAIDPASGQRLVGEAARRQATASPEYTIQSVKRFMGRKFADPDIQVARRQVTYDVRAAANGDVRIVIGDMAYAPPEISAMILRKLRLDAEARLGGKITQAVITVPASFDERQRQATRDAGQIAGLEVLRIINEPTAAALAYGLDKASKDQTVAVYNLGGGTFDISILRIGDGVFEVVSTTGETSLGGDDFTQRIVAWAFDEFQKDQAIDLSHDKVATRRLAEAAEAAKIELSTVVQTEIALPFITTDAQGPRHLTLTLSRSRLEQLTSGLVELTAAACRRALDAAYLVPSQIDHVVLVGGQTRMPAIGAHLATLFGREPHRGINPDEAVAVGAAIQAGVLAGDLKNILLLDVTSHTLAIETAGTLEVATPDDKPGDPVYVLRPQANGGVMTTIIPRNTTIPTSKRETFTTADDGQVSVEVHILQGDRPVAKENTSLARFVLDGILPAPKHLPQIEVTIDIDANGITSASAKDKMTGKEQSIVVRAGSGLSQAEIEQMTRESELSAAAERLRREETAERHRAENLTRTADKALRASGDRLPDALKSELEAKTRALRDALMGADVTVIRACQTALWDALDRVRQTIQLTKAQPASRECSRPPSGRDTT